MNLLFLLLTLCAVIATTLGWSTPFYPVHHSSRYRRPIRFTRFAPQPPPHYRFAVTPRAEKEESTWPRQKREHDDYRDHDYGHQNDQHRSTSGVTGPVHTFVKTDKNANYKWGVRHHVGDKYAS